MESFQRDLNRIAPDLRIVMNTTIERYQVVQIRKNNVGSIYVPDNYKSNDKMKPWVLFTIQTDDGSFRQPNQGDLLKCITAVENYNKLQSIGSEKYADQMDKRTSERELAQRIKRNAMWKDVERDIEDLLIKKRRHTSFGS